MRKVIIADFKEYNDPFNKLGNWHYANLFAEEGFEVLWVSCPWNLLMYFKDKELCAERKALSKPERHLLRGTFTVTNEGCERGKDSNCGSNCGRIGTDAEGAGGAIYGFAPYSWKLYGNYPGCRSPLRIFNMHKSIRPDISQSLKDIDFNYVDLLWISNPKQYWLTEAVNYKKLIYRIPDDFSGHRDFPDSISEVESALIDKADHIFVTSEKLMRKASERGKFAAYLPNGADFEHFNKAYEKPVEYKQCKRPIVVYVGAVSDWFDEGLVVHVAAMLQVDIFIVGRVKKDMKLLNRMENVHILGGRSYESIPSYMVYADAALIPFIKSDFTDAVSPIKLFEYCSAGVNVVSTALRQVFTLNAPVSIAKSREEFARCVEKAINNPRSREELKEFGRRNSWNTRFESAKEEVAWDIGTK